MAIGINSSYSEPNWDAPEPNLYARIRELEATLVMIRDEAAFNLSSPGNEDDTLNQIIDRVTDVMFDQYEFDEAKYFGDDDA